MFRSEKYDKIGEGYNNTRQADPFIASKIMKLLNPISGGKYLDIGCGTGNYTIEFNKKGVDIIGMDPSSEMLGVANSRNSKIHWKQGYAEKANLSNGNFDGIIACLTIHHWTDLEAGFLEMRRGLSEKGRIVIFTSTPKQMEGYWLNHYFPDMMIASISQMPSFNKVEQALKNAGFNSVIWEPYSIQPTLKDMFLYCGKYQPQLYLNSTIRQGISSFSSLANKNEVNQGLEKLSKDIADKKIYEIIKKYANDFGDYMFVKGSISK